MRVAGGERRKAWRWLLVGWWYPVLILLAPVANAAAGPLDALIAAAHSQALGEKPAWHRLLYYRQRWSGQVTSVVDSAEFFFAADGATDAAAELDATLAAMVLPLAAVDGDADRHPQCRFPARWAFLRAHLPLAAAGVPSLSCPALTRWLGWMGGDRVAMVFTAFYAGNPASLFGHTFLRIGRGVSAGAGRRGSPLLEPVISFAADIEHVNPFTYPFLGLSGGFPGRFHSGRYFERIQEYNNWESRDLWDYELSLSKAAVERLLLSLWELGPQYINYFYLDENCSLLLLMLLEAGEPTLDLQARAGWVVAPQDALRAVTDSPGLVQGLVFRPSARRRFEVALAVLSPGERASLARLLALEGPDLAASAFAEALPASGSERPAAIIDAALEYITYTERLAAARQPERYAGLYRHLLRRRSELADAPLREVPPRWPPPDQGHASTRLGLGLIRDAGSLQAGGAEADAGGWPSMLVAWHLKLHDGDADPTGYHPWLAIGFLRGQASYLPATRAWRLRELRVVDILSLAPLAPFETQPSWALSLGWTEMPARTGGLERRFLLHGGLGLAAASPDEHWLAYAMLTSDASLGARGDGRAGLGGSLNLRARWDRRLGATVALERTRDAAAAAVFDTQNARGAVTVSPTPAWELRLEGLRQLVLGSPVGGVERQTWSSLVTHYF